VKTIERILEKIEKEEDERGKINTQEEKKLVRQIQAVQARLRRLTFKHPRIPELIGKREIGFYNRFYV